MSICRYTVLLGLTSLVSIPYTTIAVAELSLREEAPIYRAQGYDAQQRGDMIEARSAYQKAVALDPGYAAPHNDLGVLFEQEGRLEEAEVAYRRALTLDPNYPEPHANLAMLYERMGQPEKAAYHWKRRYEMGDAHEPGTRRARERLFGLGPLTAREAARTRQVAELEFQRYEQSLKEMHPLFDEYAPDRMSE